MTELIHAEMLLSHHPFSKSDRLLTLSSEYLHLAGIIGFGREVGRDDGSYPSP